MEEAVWRIAQPFVLGGLSGIGSTTIVYPLDVIKVRMQLTGEAGSVVNTNLLRMGSHILRGEGLKGFYTGLSAAFVRQITYTTARLGIYQTMWGHFKSSGKEGFSYKATSGLMAGGIGSIFGTPADVALTRMQADRALPEGQRRGYRNVIHAFMEIGAQEGAYGFFKGNVPVIIRAMALNMGMLSTHDQALESLSPYLNGVPLSFGAKAIAGFFASALSLPFDFVKIRVQKQVPNPDGSLYYRGFRHCIQRVLQEEGARAFYRGFFTYYIRIGPQAMITLAILDSLRQIPRFRIEE